MSYQELPVQMHPRYKEFLDFMSDCPYRKTPSEMQTAFWVWLNKNENKNKSLIVVEQAKELTILKNDLDRLHRERDNFQQQCSAMAEENLRLMQQIENIKTLLDNGSIGERGDACMAIDGGNL